MFYELVNTCYILKQGNYNRGPLTVATALVKLKATDERAELKHRRSS